MNRPLLAQETSHTLSSATDSQAVDPNKGPSEFNHHIAGWALIGVALMALASSFSPGLKNYTRSWPLLFILAGLFLALWSDAEIWPRGNLSWLWLLHHDAEARQHKIYSILLIAIGAVEYFRLRGSMPRFWRVWAFPVIAAAGACMLLIHDHSAASGARSPEAAAYLVDPNLDVDGNPRGFSATALPVAHAAEEHSGMHDASATNAGIMPMDHSQMMMDGLPANPAPASHHHTMTASMVRIERQHLWFMIVGLAIALFKFISDSERFRNRIVPCLWPSCMLLLGLLLVLYRE
ncbi:MAG TPA: hypothetical protein VK466_00295 [Terriglobales bacterium]|nr:hypothetical protein [Terriglobales bacterium]